MAVLTTTYADAAFAPGMTTDVFVPDQLIGGDLKIVTHNNRTLAQSGTVLKRGSVLGRIAASGKYALATSAANDGSQTPVAILVDDADATAGDANIGIYAMGEFNANAVIIGAGLTLDAVKAALEAQNVYLKTPVSAADPT